jgi:hypothetical protein
MLCQTDFTKRVEDLVNCINHIPDLRQLLVTSTYEPKQGRRVRKTIFESTSAPPRLTQFIYHTRDQCLLWPKILHSADYTVTALVPNTHHCGDGRNL